MSSRKIEDLDPRFQPIVRQLLNAGQESIRSTGWELFITDGYRSFEEQTKLYAQGRTEPGKVVTNAKAGQSPHNYGMAVDLAFQRAGELSYNPNLYAPVYAIARSLGISLGADWTGFVDRPHFEFSGWERLVNKPQNGAGGVAMTEFYPAQEPHVDLSNRKSVEAAVDTWVRVVKGEFVTKIDHEKALNDLRQKMNNERDAAVNQAFIDGEQSGKENLSLPAQSASLPLSFDPSVWEQNGLTIETTEGNQKTIVNFKRKAA